MKTGQSCLSEIIDSVQRLHVLSLRPFFIPCQHRTVGNYQFLCILFWRGYRKRKIYFCAVYVCKELCCDGAPLGYGGADIRIWSSLLSTGKWICSKSKRRTVDSWCLLFSMLMSYLWSRTREGMTGQHSKGWDQCSVTALQMHEVWVFCGSMRWKTLNAQDFIGLVCAYRYICKHVYVHMQLSNLWLSFVIYNVGR